jgi:hypothetical protein
MLEWKLLHSIDTARFSVIPEWSLYRKIDWSFDCISSSLVDLLLVEMIYSYGWRTNKKFEKFIFVEIYKTLLTEALKSISDADQNRMTIADDALTRLNQY